jgi:hypothetical protein
MKILPHLLLYAQPERCALFPAWWTCQVSTRGAPVHPVYSIGLLKSLSHLFF